MKKKDIEKLLKAEISNNIPDVLPQVLSTPVVREEYKENKTSKKKYNFKFRYLYAGLAMCAVLVIGIGILLPNMNKQNLYTNDTATYMISTNFEVANYNVDFKFNQNNQVVSILVKNGSDEIHIENASNMQDGLLKIVDYLIEKNAFDVDKEITLRVSSENLDKLESDKSKFENYLLKCLIEKGLNDVTIA